METLRTGRPGGITMKASSSGNIHYMRVLRIKWHRSVRYGEVALTRGFSRRPVASKWWQEAQAFKIHVIVLRRHFYNGCRQACSFNTCITHNIRMAVEVAAALAASYAKTISVCLKFSVIYIQPICRL